MAVSRYLFAVRYTYLDDTWAEEPICVRAETETAARADVDAATTRYPTAVGVTKTITLVLTTADV
jgi:hypothetical protein